MFGRVPKYWDWKTKKGLGAFKTCKPRSRDGIKIEPEDAVTLGTFVVKFRV
jgi:hypothetical protein